MTGSDSLARSAAFQQRLEDVKVSGGGKIFLVSLKECEGQRLNGDVNPFQALNWNPSSDWQI